MPRASSTSSVRRWFVIAQPEPALGRPKPDPWDPTAERIEHDGQIEETGGGRARAAKRIKRDVGKPELVRRSSREVPVHESGSCVDIG